MFLQLAVDDFDSGLNGHHHHHQNEDHDYRMEGDFRLSAHVTDLDSLLGRSEVGVGVVDKGGGVRCPRPHEVTWPPPSPTLDEEEQHPSRSGVMLLLKMMTMTVLLLTVLTIVKNNDGP